MKKLLTTAAILAALTAPAATAVWAEGGRWWVLTRSTTSGGWFDHCSNQDVSPARDYEEGKIVGETNRQLTEEQTLYRDPAWADPKSAPIVRYSYTNRQGKQSYIVYFKSEEVCLIALYWEKYRKKKQEEEERNFLDKYR
jgi:hypothetical protein